MLSAGCGRSHYSLLHRYDWKRDSKSCLVESYPLTFSAGRRHRTKEEAEEDEKFTRVHDSLRLMNHPEPDPDAWKELVKTDPLAREIDELRHTIERIEAA